MYITSDVMILNATVEWAKWEENLLLSGEAEARSSNELQKKLSSVNWLYFLYAVLIVHHIYGLEVQDECSTAKALVMPEYAVNARATENKKKIIHCHDEVLYMIY